MKTQAIPSLDDLLREDRKMHTERQSSTENVSVGAFHQDEQNVATQAIDVGALLSGQVPGMGLSAAPDDALETERVDVAAVEAAAATVQDQSVGRILGATSQSVGASPSSDPTPSTANTEPKASHEASSATPSIAPPPQAAQPASIAPPPPSQTSPAAQKSKDKGNKKVWILVGVIAFVLLVCCPGSLFGAYKAGLLPGGLSPDAEAPSEEPPSE